MGLDMYLYAKKNIAFINDEECKEKVADRLQGYEDESGIEVGYWRKANAIHKWFVDNTQNGEDECHTSNVTRDDLRKLLRIVNLVLEDNNKAKDILPAQTGFFFGGTDYDEWFFKNLKHTGKVLRKGLRMKKD